MNKKEHPKEKLQLHPRNKHRERYNFKALILSCPKLAPYVFVNAYQDESIDFFNPEAVKMLNTALLKRFYGVEHWMIPPNYLCPPIPGRADYIHQISDLLASNNAENIPTGKTIRCLDIGVGANCIYPIIGATEYGWTFVGTDIDPFSIESASNIIQMNPSLQGKVEFRRQHNPKNIFPDILRPGKHFDLTICNPPFHASAEESNAETLRKLSNLKNKKILHPKLNFGGKNNELWCEGGEERFIRNMIRQSREYSTSVFWFSSLVSKQSHLKSAYRELDKTKAAEVKTIPMGQGNKISRVLAWTYLSKEQQKLWIKSRWNGKC